MTVCEAHGSRWFDGDICLKCRVEELERLINRWQFMGSRQILDVAAKIFGEMQKELKKEEAKTDVLVVS